MHKTTRLDITDLNRNLLCVLCSGYLIDATTIIECLHSFCKSCIVTYLENSKYCPICDVQIHKTKPLLNIRSDQTLQDIVYKLVPGLFKDEMKRRRAFYVDHPKEAKKLKNNEGRGEVDELHKIYTEDEKVSVCIQHCVRLPPYHNGSSFNTSNIGREEKGGEKRYLLCPVGLTIGLVKKFIRLKFELEEKYQVEVFHSDESIADDYTLMDVAYIYGWRRMEPLKLYYIVFDKTEISLDLPGMEEPEISLNNGKNRSKKKRGRKRKSASSQDVSCDDDTTSEISNMTSGNGNSTLEKNDTTTSENCNASTSDEKPKSSICLEDSMNVPLDMSKANISQMLQNASESESKAENNCSHAANNQQDKNLESGSSVTTSVVTNNEVVTSSSMASSSETDDKNNERIPSSNPNTDDEDDEDLPLAKLKVKMKTFHQIDNNSGVDNSAMIKSAEEESETKSNVEVSKSSHEMDEDSSSNVSESDSDKENSNFVRNMNGNYIPGSNNGEIMVNNKSPILSNGAMNDTNNAQNQDCNLLQSSSGNSSNDISSSNKVVSLNNTNSVMENKCDTPENCNTEDDKQFLHRQLNFAAAQQLQQPLLDNNTDSSSKICTSSSTDFSEDSSELESNIVAGGKIRNIVPCSAINNSANNDESCNNNEPSAWFGKFSLTSPDKKWSIGVKNNNYKNIVPKTMFNSTNADRSTDDGIDSNVDSKANLLAQLQAQQVTANTEQNNAPHPVLNTQPIALYPNAKILAGHQQQTTLPKKQDGIIPLYTANTIPTHSIKTEINDSAMNIKNELLKFQIHGKYAGVANAAVTTQASKTSPSLAEELMSHFGPAILQSINPAQKVQTIVESIKRKRGRPPKDKTKLLEQLKAQQSPAKLPRLLPKGYPAPQQFYQHQQGGNAVSNQMAGNRPQAVQAMQPQVPGGVPQQFCALSGQAYTMANGILPQTAQFAAMNGIPVFNNQLLTQLQLQQLQQQMLLQQHLQKNNGIIQHQQQQQQQQIANNGNNINNINQQQINNNMMQAPQQNGSTIHGQTLPFQQQQNCIIQQQQNGVTRQIIQPINGQSIFPGAEVTAAMSLMTPNGVFHHPSMIAPIGGAGNSQQPQLHSAVAGNPRLPNGNPQQQQQQQQHTPTSIGNSQYPPQQHPVLPSNHFNNSPSEVHQSMHPIPPNVEPITITPKAEKVES